MTMEPSPRSESSARKSGPPKTVAAGAAEVKNDRKGLRFERYYTRTGVDPFDAVDWETRGALIVNEKGEKVFEQLGVEVPSFLSQTATNVVVIKYFRGSLGAPERETSVRQLIGRVFDKMALWGRDGGYFAGEEDAETFHAELTINAPRVSQSTAKTDRDGRPGKQQMNIFYVFLTH